MSIYDYSKDLKKVDNLNYYGSNDIYANKIYCKEIDNINKKNYCYGLPNIQYFTNSGTFTIDMTNILTCGKKITIPKRDFIVGSVFEFNLYCIVDTATQTINQSTLNFILNGQSLFEDNFFIIQNNTATDYRNNIKIIIQVLSQNNNIFTVSTVGQWVTNFSPLGVNLYSSIKSITVGNDELSYTASLSLSQAGNVQVNINRYLIDLSRTN